MTTYTATYSPDDNKLRLYASSRLDADTYARAKALGFRWAPKQELFVCPSWSPAAEDFLIELAGEIDDEDTTLCERAEQRAERFEDYSANRAEDAERAHKAVASICDNIPFGQPILVGHHSEKHARKDAERIESGMRRAVKMFDQSKYWTERAAGALANAKYKERPDVRARRIKKLEADLRRVEKSHAQNTAGLAAWNKCAAIDDAEKQNKFAVIIAGHGHGLYMPRKEGDRPDFNQSPSAYDALTGSYPSLYAPRTIAEVIAVALADFPRRLAHCARWIAHYSNRLAYERAMLAESGGTVADKTGPEVGGAVQCLWAPRGGWAYIVKVNKVTITIRHQWNDGGRVFAHNEPLDKLRAVMTRAQVEEARGRGAIKENAEGFGFWLLQSREDFDKAQTVAEAQSAPEPAKTAAADIDAMRETLRAGVQVVTASQLFPTPRELAERMARLADIQPGMRVLEPSAGTGALLGAMGARMFGHNPERGCVHAVEINAALAGRLQREFPLTTVHCADFLRFQADDFEPFDVILMNPPFQNGDDIKHITHARRFLAPGGVLIALCANGPRQQDKLGAIAEEYEPLPAGTFKDAGTMVTAALVIIREPALPELGDAEVQP